MALEKYWTLDLKDLAAIELVCKSCRATQSFPPANWKGQIPNACPNCHQNWIPLNGFSEVSLQHLITNFERFLADEQARGCKTRLRIGSVPSTTTTPDSG